MKKFVDNLRASFPKSVAHSCAARRCSIRVDVNPKSTVILNLDKHQENYSKGTSKLCDFLIFHANTKIAVCAAELKGGNVKAKQARDQIQEGAVLAESILEKRKTTDFHPVLVRNRSKRLDPLDYKFFQNNLVNFQKTQFHIQIVPTGDPLSRILSL